MAKQGSSTRKNQQRQATVRLLLLTAILICVNLIASRLHFGIDLTEEKRFTLSPSTKRLLKNMDEVAVVEVYLKGELPSGFQRLAATTRERLSYFKEIAGKNLVFRFSDPFEGKREDEKGPIFQALAKKGINGTNLQLKTDEGYSEKIIFPCALVKYKGREFPINLLENDRQGMSPMEVLNYSESLLEYKFASALNFLSRPDQTRIAYIVGHDEMLGPQTRDMLMTLSTIYRVDTLYLPGELSIKGPGTGLFDAIIINKPRAAFDDKEKFKIDQFVMRGGSVLWALDGVIATMDSLKGSNESFLTQELPLNLDDLLFNCGVRVNANLIEDMDCNPIPVVVGMTGDQPQAELRPWIYFPVLMPSAKHPIVHNLDPVKTMFTSSIDTIANPDIRKTVLLASSKYSRVTPHPARVSLSMMAYKPDNKLFNKGYQPVAVLAEGKFKSTFNNRFPASFLAVLRDSLKMPFKGQCDTPAKMIIISDGDVFENDYSQREGTMDMGYWRFTGNFFSNKAFMLNCMEYLTDRSGLLESRSKDVKLRLLDSGRVKDEQTKWQWINIALPIGLVLIFASAYIFFRKRRFEKPSA
ncbi:gliding motility-associated ABC transporter substrate-binding protein GldG [Rurimicrobium arvi]|uniref:Gliding motility-associated ABC transporter substrate-binding protein GldG n=1 Tax=Rurimicrobium arvi TaxID=2049916 RepID=A0ABP8MY75_9BACT